MKRDYDEEEKTFIESDTDNNASRGEDKEDNNASHGEDKEDNDNAKASPKAKETPDNLQSEDMDVDSE